VSTELMSAKLMPIGPRGHRNMIIRPVSGLKTIAHHNHMRQAGRLDYEVGRKDVLPALFNAAGLIVPEPAIMSVPMPFADVETGCEVEYMAGRSTRTARRGSARRGRWRRERRARGKSWVAAFLTMQPEMDRMGWRKRRRRRDGSHAAKQIVKGSTGAIAKLRRGACHR